MACILPGQLALVSIWMRLQLWLPQYVLQEDDYYSPSIYRLVIGLYESILRSLKNGQWVL